MLVQLGHIRQHRKTIDHLARRIFMVGEDAHRTSHIGAVAFDLITQDSCRFTFADDHHIQFGIAHAADAVAFQHKKPVCKPAPCDQQELQNSTNKVVCDRHTANKDQRASNVNGSCSSICQEYSVQIIEACVFPAVVVKLEQHKNNHTQHRVKWRKFPESRQIPIHCNRTERLVHIKADNQR